MVAEVVEVERKRGRERERERGRNREKERYKQSRQCVRLSKCDKRVVQSQRRDEFVMSDQFIMKW